MVLVNVNGNEYHISKLVYKPLLRVKKKVISNSDLFTGIVDGRVGTGKSTLAAQLAYFCSDGKLTLDNVVFTPKQFMDQLNNAKPGTNIILDEAFDTMNKRKSRSAENMEVLSLMQKMRVKRVFIWIVLPYYYDLDKNVILGLADILFHVWRKDFGTRGSYSVYDRKKLKSLWLTRRQYYDYPKFVEAPNFHSKFNKFFPFNEDEYQKKKIESFTKAEQDTKSKKIERIIEHRAELINILREKGMKIKEIAGKLNISASGVSKIIERSS